MDVAWRRTAVNSLQLVGRCPRARPRVRDRRSLPHARGGRLPAHRRRLLRGHAGRGAHRLPRSCAPTRCSCRSPTRRSTVSRAGSRSATSSTSRRCSPSARGCSAQGAYRARRRRRAHQRTRACRARLVVPPASCRSSAACSPTGARTRTFPASTAYLPPRSTAARDRRRRPASSMSAHRTLGAGAAQLITGDARVTRSDARLTTVRPRSLRAPSCCPTPSELLDHFGADGAAWLDGTARTSSPRASPRSSTRATRSRVLRAIVHDASRPTRRSSARGPSARSRSPGGGRMIVPARIVERAADGRLWRTEIEPGRGAPCSPTRRSDAGDDATRSRRSPTPHGWEANVAADPRARRDGRGREGRARARGASSTPTSPFDIRDDPRHLARDPARMRRVRRRRLRRREPGAARPPTPVTT